MFTRYNIDSVSKLIEQVKSFQLNTQISNEVEDTLLTNMRMGNTCFNNINYSFNNSAPSVPHYEVYDSSLNKSNSTIDGFQLNINTLELRNNDL